MRVLMQQRPQGDELPRFVQLMLQPDLLGGWTLVRETGHIGGRSQVRREQYLERDAAFAAFEKAREQQAGRGFLVVFSEGSQGPR